MPKFKSAVTADFLECLYELPVQVQQQARRAYHRFREDPAHRGLQFKKVRDVPLTYSARVGLSYRALGLMEGDTVYWFWIGTHAEYDRLI